MQCRGGHNPWKEGLQYFLPYFLLFGFPRLHGSIDWARGHTALDKEFQQIIRNAKVGKWLADKLFKVWLKNGKEAWLLLHVEIQGQVDKKFPRRMFQYNYRGYDLFGRRVISLAILCDDRPDWRPGSFAYGGWGCKMGLVFPVVKLLDYADDQDRLETSDNPIAQVVLAHLKATETRRDPAQRRFWKIRLVKGLYERGWKAEDVRQLFRLIDWIMDLPRELQEGFREELHYYEEGTKMPYLSSIERMAQEEGLEKGLEKGRQEGHRAGLLEAIETGLRAKFGAAGLKLLPKVRAVNDSAKLKDLTQVLMTADELRVFREHLSNR